MSKIAIRSVIYVQGGKIMKKFALYIFITLTLFCLSSCMVKYSAPVTCTDVQTGQVIEYAAKDQEVILEILNQSGWRSDVPKCPSDYKFNTEKGVVGYIVEEAMLVDYKRKRHRKLTEEEANILLGMTCIILPETFHEHVTGDWEYSDTHHWRITTCKDGLCDIDPLLEEHIDSDNNHICDVCSYEIPHEHTSEWGWSEECHWFYYTCGCPSNDIAELHTDYDENNACDICDYIMLPASEDTFLHEFEPWLLVLTSENVKQLKTTIEYIGVAPGRLKSILRTKDKTNIQNLIDAYKSITLTEIPRDEALVTGGSGFTIEFILNDGASHSLYFNNGNYQYYEPELSLSLFFALSEIPTLENGTNLSFSYSFITYLDVGTLYVYDNTTEPATPIKVGEFNNIGALEFEAYPYVPYPTTKPTHHLETEFGILYIIDEVTFYIQSGCEIMYFRLTNNAFYLTGDV